MANQFSAPVHLGIADMFQEAKWAAFEALFLDSPAGILLLAMVAGTVAIRVRHARVDGDDVDFIEWFLSYIGSIFR